MTFTIIGISDSTAVWFPPEVLEAIGQGTVFSGGRRHRELVAHLLPAAAQWIDIVAPLDAVFAQYEGHDHIVVFASGDPLFFGFANTVRRKMPSARIRLYPSFNSLQLLAHRLVLPYHDMRVVSLTGRPWHEFDAALISCSPKMGVLTDKEHTPDVIARRMLDYGYSGYTMHVGEHLGNPERERVSSLSLEEAASSQLDQPNCLILTGSHHRRWGIPDGEFALLDGRERMITKMPIRLMTLQALELAQCDTMWDIGFCTGSVSIEARLQFPHLRVESFEVRSECAALMATNSRRFGTPGIGVHIGDFLACDLESIVAATGRPQAVFIGGHGGRLKEMLQRVVTVLADDGVVVMNSVTVQSRRLWDEACETLHLTQEQPVRVVIDDYNPIEILKCRK